MKIIIEKWSCCNMLPLENMFFSGFKSSLDYKTQFNDVLFYNSCLKVLYIARKEPTNFTKKKAQQSDDYIGVNTWQQREGKNSLLTARATNILLKEYSSLLFYL